MANFADDRKLSCYEIKMKMQQFSATKFYRKRDMNGMVQREKILRNMAFERRLLKHTRTAHHFRSILPFLLLPTES